MSSAWLECSLSCKWGHYLWCLSKCWTGGTSPGERPLLWCVTKTAPPSGFAQRCCGAVQVNTATTRPLKSQTDCRAEIQRWNKQRMHGVCARWLYCHSWGHVDSRSSLFWLHCWCCCLMFPDWKMRSRNIKWQASLRLLALTTPTQLPLHLLGLLKCKTLH